MDVSSAIKHGLLSFVAIILLAHLLRTGVELQRSTVLVRPGCCVTPFYRSPLSLIGIDRFYNARIWNFLMVSGGVLINMLVAGSFDAHERYLAAIASGRDRRGKPDLPRVLRPILQSTATGYHRMLSGWTYRSLCIISTISVITSTALLATFGISYSSFQVPSPLPQVLTRELAYLNANRPVWEPVMSKADMLSIIYRSAYLRTLEALGGVETVAQTQSFSDHLSPVVGSVMFQNLRTRGIGGASSSLISSAYPWNELSSGLSIDSLWAGVVGSNITATCRDVTSEWQWKHAQASGTSCPSTFRVHHSVGMADIRVPCGADIGIHTWLGDDLGCVVPALPSHLGDPKLVHQHFLIPRAHRTWLEDGVTVVPSLLALDCAYSGTDIRNFIAVPASDKPIEFLQTPEAESLVDLTIEDMTPAAVAISLVLEHKERGIGRRMDGGALADGLGDAGLQEQLIQKTTNEPNIDFSRLLESILTDAAQAYFTLLRQGEKRQFVPSGPEANGQMRGRALRRGGGGWVWIGIIATLMIVPLVALIRIALAAWLYRNLLSDEEYDSDEDSIAEGLLNEDEREFLPPDRPSLEFTMSEKAEQLLDYYYDDKAVVDMGE